MCMPCQVLLYLILLKFAISQACLRIHWYEHLRAWTSSMAFLLLTT